MTPLLYLELRQLINSIKNTTRSPRRLIPVLIMGAWLVSLFIRGIMAYTTGQSSTPNFSALGAIPTELIEPGVFLFMSIGSVLVMYGAFSSGMMVFSVAHIDFLFPTPISRRTVLLIKLAKDYIKYGFYVAFFFMFIGYPVFGIVGVQLMPWGLVSIAAVTALLVIVINLAHTINIIFTFGFERMKQAELVLRAVLIGVPVSALAIGIYQYLRTGDTFTSIILAADSPVMRVVFAPARWTARLFLAPLVGVTTEELVSLLFLVSLALISFLVLLGRRENIYEPALGVSVKYQARRAAMRSGDYAGMRTDALREKGARRAGGPAIPPFGQGAMAVLWKSLLLRYRLSATQLAMMLILPVVIVAVIIHTVRSMSLDTSVLHMLPLTLLYLVWILSMMAPGEMRSELKQANILKSMPIAAWKIMLAQAINSTAYLTLGSLVFAATMLTMVPESRNPLLGACLLAVPFLGFVNVAISLICAIFYPDLRDPAQSFLGGMVSFFLISLALIPSLVIGILTLAVLHWSYFAAAAAVSAANLIVGAAGVAFAGYLFHRYDPTSE